MCLCPRSVYEYVVYACLRTCIDPGSLPGKSAHAAWRSGQNNTVLAFKRTETTNQPVTSPAAAQKQGFV